jgi:hypothetical protein
MRTEARVSVIMAFLDAEPFIEEAIDSVLAQTFQDWELLLVDDGSRDASSKIARRFAAADPERIRYLSHEDFGNRGPSASRNLALGRAEGEYVAILDADDIWEPRRLEKQVAFLDAQPDVALVGSWYTEIDSGGRVGRRATKPCSDLDIRWAMLFYCPFLHSTVTFRREPVLEQVGGYDESLRTSEDYQLWQRVAARFPVANVPDALVRYRVHDRSLTATVGRSSASGSRVREAPAVRLLGWDPSDASTTARLGAMRALLLGWESQFGPDELRQASEDILAVHETFCSDRGVEPVEARRHRKELRHMVARNLIRLTLADTAADTAARRAALGRAWELHRRHFLRPGILLKSGVLVAKESLRAARPAGVGG